MIDHRPVGTGALGEVSLALRRLYADATRGHLPQYRKWLVAAGLRPVAGRAA
jgi:hypothetical protein